MPWPVVATAAYVGPVREIVVAWKDRGRADLTGRLTDVIGTVARELAADLWEQVGDRHLWVVPAPSTAAARRRRGREPVADLAHAVLDALAADPAACHRASLVRAVRHGTGLQVRVQDQAGLGRRARGRNLGGALRPSAQARRYRQSAAGPVVCVLVDDVLTTGATFAECERVLGSVGVPVVAGLVLAATPAPGQARARADGGPLGLGAGGALRAHRTG